MSKKDLIAAMYEMSIFAEINYKKGFTPEIVAEYTSLYMNFYRIFEKMHNAGEDTEVSYAAPSLKGDELDEMTEWEHKMVAMIEASLVKNGVPQKN